MGNVLGAGDGLADGAGDGRLVDGHAVGKDVDGVFVGPADGNGDGALDGASLVVGKLLGNGDCLADGRAVGYDVDGVAEGTADGHAVGHGDGALDGIFVGAGVGLHVVAGTHAQLQCTSVRCMPPGQCSPHFQPMCPFIWFPLVRSM